MSECELIYSINWSRAFEHNGIGYPLQVKREHWMFVKNKKLYNSLDSNFAKEGIFQAFRI